MARLALTLGATAAGALIGAQFGGAMLGAQLGFMVGSIASALLLPGGADQHGPRLGDLTVGDASYGVSIPLVYGTAQVPGTMIWTSGLEERASEESLKGGGPTSTSYAYFASFAIGLCAGPIASVRKIWLDTKLVYDVSSTNLGIVNQRIGELDPRNLLDADERADKVEEIQTQLAKVSSALTIYLGTETQLPDPVMEAHEGLGQVPAHRGLAYLAFEDLPLDAYGNRIPTVRAEVQTTSALAYPKQSVLPSVPLEKDQMVFDDARKFIWSLQQQNLVQIDAMTRTLMRSEAVDTVPSAGQPMAVSIGHCLAVDRDGFLYVPIDGTSAALGNIARLDPVSFQVTHIGRSLTTAAPVQLGHVSCIQASDQYIWAGSYGVIHDCYCLLRPGVIDPRTGQPTPQMWLLATVVLPGGGAAPTARMVAVDRDDTGWFLCSMTTANPLTMLVHMNNHGAAQTYDLTAAVAYGAFIAYDGNAHQLLIAGKVPTAIGTSRVLRWDIATESVTGQADGIVSTDYQASSWKRGVIGRRLWFTYGHSIRALDVDTMSIVRDDNTGAAGGFPSADFYGGLYDPAGNTFWVAETGLGVTAYYLDRLEVQPVTLASIVEDLSVRAGLQPADVVTSALTDEVHGFVVSQRSEARSSVDLLTQAFLADAVESDWHLLYMHRDLEPVATLTRHDLAAHEDKGQLPDVVTPERLNDLQLPIRVDITYADPAIDYQDNNQHARRMQAGQLARSERSVRTPVILSATQAKHLAEQTLAEAWLQRMSYRFSLSYKWAALDPGDVVTVDDGSRQTVMRLTAIHHGANGVLEVQAMGYDRATYAPSPSVGALPAITLEQSLMPVPPTALFLLDIPLLRDIDDSSGYYLAMAPQSTGDWGGAVAMSSVDAASWRQEATVTTAVDYGSAMTVLGVGSPYVIDNGHSVDVRLARGTLSSCTELDMLNGANGFLLGNEIIQAQTVTLLAPDTYRLSTLLRGRRGTEHFISTHTYGERFLVLTPQTLRRGQMGLSEVGTTRLYQAVTLGTDAFNGATQPFSNTGRGIQCYSVEHVTGTRDTSNTVTITWVRRTRVGGAWLDGHDASLGEITEAYESDIVVAGTVRRTLTSSTPSVVYSAANQTTDGITPGQPVTVTIYQMGQLGRGVPTTATV